MVNYRHGGHHGNDHIRTILNNIENERSPRAKPNAVKTGSFEDLDTPRSIITAKCVEERQVIYGASKTKEQIEGITNSLLAHCPENILITRLSPESAAYLSERFTLFYDEASRIGIVNRTPHITAEGTIVVATGGTSDIPVAEEAALTAEVLGNKVVRVYDVGVAGLHRLLSNMELLSSANAIVAVAGMEGALASVIGGLVDCPVIGVPTSVGYGASFHGISALLSMLNSCASGVSVVNIDNGFGAGYLASMINHIGG
ncbi:nickel pincer cofactor biosynthesis protein LarB [Clostridium fessum]|uniref:nickel pincer cofactor biosynthesis protein LarB n=1 Tax=Clostridium fessum TaxID=2126740 RepID=UPI00399B807B